MIVLSRKRNESIIINDDIIITVVEVRGDKVRIGIDAPKEMTVHRKEVYDTIYNKNQKSEIGGLEDNVGEGGVSGIGEGGGGGTGTKPQKYLEADYFFQIDNLYNPLNILATKIFKRELIQYF